MSAPPAPNSIAPIIAQWMDFDDDDTEGQEFAQAVASAVWDALLDSGYFRESVLSDQVDFVLPLPLAGLDTDTP